MAPKPVRLSTVDGFTFPSGRSENLMFESSNRTGPTRRQEAFPKDDLFLCMRPVLVVARVSGTLPLGSILLLNQDALPSFSFRSCFPLVIFLMYFIVHDVTTLALIGRLLLVAPNRLGNRLDAIRSGAMYESIIFDCLNIVRQFVLLFKSRKLCHLFREWRRMTPNLYYRREDTKLCRKILWVFIFFLSTGIIDQSLNNLQFIDEERAHNELNSSFLETHYRTGDLMLADVVPFNYVIGILSFCSYKLIFLQIILSSLLVTCTVIAVDEKFKTLVALLEHKEDWKHARTDYIALRNFVDLLNDTMSITLAFEFAIILYFTTILAVMVIAPNGRSTMRTAYAISAIVHLLVRFCFLSIPAGNINEAPKKIMKILQESSKFEYNDEAQRLERILNQQIGISCYGVFTLTKGFILQFANAVFTLVIILLQALAGKSESF